MSRLLLVVPELLWPAPQTHCPTQDMPLAALARLLGSGRRRREAPEAAERLLARLFGMEKEGEPPLAALRRLGEGDGEGDPAAHWLCADPVHLSMTQKYLLLGDFAEGEVDAATAGALIDALNADFAGLGRFYAATPTRWYLRLERPPAVRFAPLAEVAGRPIQDFLPAGDDGEARRWLHVLNEIQVALHNQPLNEAREAAGQRPINGLWFWGGSARAAPMTALRSPRPVVQALDPLARGLARAAGIEPGVPDVETALRGPTLVVLDALAVPARRLDLAAWRKALAALESDWFAPIAGALALGRLRRFDLFAPGERAAFSLTSRPGSRWCFWRRPLALDALAAAFSGAFARQGR
ncbi:MAG: hypothetical protein LBF91_06125 [Azoarcus sp.]|jgi:hypothetical protein|nr:hypothetical protein [Azoarcus sp.]